MPSLSEAGEVIEIRIHGRGGQGAVVASLMLARAAMMEGRSVQAFPEFGVERRGAPVTAFLRVANRPIHLRCKVYEPHHVLVLDSQLLGQVGLPEHRAGWLVVNAATAASDIQVPAPWRAAAVDGTRIARARGLGSGALPIVNSPMAGAFARVTRLVGIEALLAAIGELAPAATEANLAAAREAWDSVRIAAQGASEPAAAAEVPR